VKRTSVFRIAVAASSPPPLPSRLTRQACSARGFRGSRLVVFVYMCVLPYLISPQKRLLFLLCAAAVTFLLLAVRQKSPARRTESGWGRGINSAIQPPPPSSIWCRHNRGGRGRVFFACMISQSWLNYAVKTETVGYGESAPLVLRGVFPFHFHPWKS